MSFSGLKDVFLINNIKGKSTLKELHDTSNIDNSDMKVMIIKDYFNHKQRG